MLNYVNISEHARDAIHIAQSYAKEYKHEKLGVSHMLRALMHKNAGLHSFLKALNKDISYITEWAEVRIDEYPSVNGQFHDVPTADAALILVMEESDNIRFKLGLDLIDSICILAAIVKPNFGYTSDQLKSLPLREKEVLDTYLSLANLKHSFSPEAAENTMHNPPNQQFASGALLSYCIDKNARAKEGKFDPVVGRDKELLMMIEILSRRSKPNVILIGEPGVGKSALLEGFVEKINKGEVPALLAASIVFELESGALLAGASYKGEVEDRLKKIIKDLKQFDKAILFIDEFHTLLDAKGPAGPGIANLLKPELARGELTIIGATTLEEYRKIIEPDAAFSRRFETLMVHEPDVLTAARMIQSLVPAYEKYHGISVHPSVMKESIRLAKRYIKDKRLPDAAIDLLDRTLAALRMMNETSLNEIEGIETDLTAISLNDALSEEEKVLEVKWLYSTLLNKISPVLSGQIEQADTITNQKDALEIQKQLTTIIAGLKKELRTKKTTLTAQDLAALVAHKTGIPVGKIQTSERERLLTIETHLQKRVIGQDHAIRILSDTIIESRSGLHKQGQPIGSFFFLGPTGTGKTELTKAIAEFLFNDEKAMIRFDMSEFKEEHAAALLYGAPPGYVGYEEGGMLVNKIRQKPYSVVLFDEIEKAHQSVFDTFLQIMDEGTLHDKLGKEGDFSNAIIIFTSNIASEWVAEQFRNGKIPNSQEIMERMTQFRPEFLARISEIIPFAPIAEQNVVKIFDIQLKILIQSVSALGITLSVGDEAKSILAHSGFTPAYGARQLATVIRTKLRRPLSKMLVSGVLKKGDTVSLILHSDLEVTWHIEHPEDQEHEQTLDIQALNTALKE
ncbi:MAG: ATP-dependent Clp protease ATP-binding subunit [Cytophagales bacterium]|nr:ATP-dependent Clp protease ATP-binding subunit [Cytophaga sp.]